MDAFRVLAVLCVFICHLNLYNDGLEGEKVLLGGNLIYIGGLAVHYFIILSAFLVAYFYENSMSQGYIVYVKKRIFRLLPINIVTLPFYVVILVYIGFYTISLERSILDVLLSSLLLQELFKFSATLFNTPSWTISTLFILYLITPLLIWPLQRINKLCVLIFLALFLTWADVEYRAWLMEIKPNNWWLNYASPVSRILSYMNGLVLGYTLKSFKIPLSIRRYTTWIELCVFAVFFYGCFIIKKDFVLCYHIIMYLTPLLIVICFMEDGIISKAIGRCGLSRLSPYVYAFYMIHYFFILLADFVCDKMMGIWGNMSMMQVLFMVVVTFVSICTASVFLHHYVEKRIT